MRFRAGPVAPGQSIAWFFKGTAPGPEREIITEPGYRAIWLPEEEMPLADLSLWHRAVIEADRLGNDIARVTE